jgi:3-hydroxyisobutyrate dehydrogenase-like beta-hydroxyacid dehydrogenase
MPVLNGFAKAVIHCGPLGAGMVAKLSQRMSSPIRMGRHSGGRPTRDRRRVALDRFIEVIEQGADAGTDPLVWMRIKQAGAAVPEDVLAPFERLAEKDLSAIDELAGELAADIPITNVIRPQISDVYRGR